MSDTEPQSEANFTAKRHQETASCITEDRQEVASGSSSEKAAEPNRETESVVTSSKLKKAPSCHFFKKAGSCRYGDKCRFAHDIPAKSQREEESGGDNGTGVVDGVKMQSETLSQEKSTEEGDQKVCHFYSRSGWCRNGKRCRFLHDKMKAISFKDESKQDKADANTQEVTADGPKDAVKVETANPKSDVIQKKEKPKKTCRYFKAGHCNSGDRCKFLHPKVEGSELTSSGQTKPIRSKGPRTAMTRPNVIQDEQVSMKLEDLGERDIKKLRETEVTQLIKRFTKDQVTVMEKEGSETVYRVTMNPTDPDWPFDIRDFEFEVMFPANYPLDPFTIFMPEDQVLPNTVLQSMSASIGEWVLARHGTNQISGRVELMFRPFLRWLDRSLERLFTDAAKKFKMVVDAKAAGIELIPYAKQKPAERRDIRRYTDIQHPDDSEGVVITHGTCTTPNPDKATDTSSVNTVTGEIHSGDTITQDIYKGHDAPSEDTCIVTTEMPSKETNNKIDLSNVQRRGIEIQLLELQLSENISTLVAQKIGVTIQCSRCRNHCDVITPPRRLNSARCGKCQHQQLVTFRQSLIHHFTATLGFLDLEGCTTFDLILAECVLAIGCLNCSEETNVRGLQFGQIRTLWCEKCHTKMTLQLQTAKFNKLQVQTLEKLASDNVHTIQVKQMKKQVHPDIHEGHPLPHQGTCKHFKKSFRWLRFPCCGKCYPCDECHHDKEPDHEMKYANRMICGFCCKEQQYSPDKPCISCQSLTTKSRTSHWEGGMGCRNKTKMSKTDKQKYSSVSKTVSRKQQNLVADKKAK